MNDNQDQQLSLQFNNLIGNVKSSQQLLPLVMNNIPQAIFWKNRNSIYLGCNQKFADDAGLKIEEIIGKTDYDLPWAKEEADFCQESDRQVMESNTPRLGIIESQIQGNGKQAWLKTNKIPLCNAQGEVVGILGTYEDITQQKQIKEFLVQQSLAMESASEGMAILIDNRYVYLNKAHVNLYGYQDSTQLIGKTWHTLYDEAEVTRLETEAFPILINQGNWQGEALAKHRDGSYFYQEISLTLINHNSLICICRDISQTKTIQIALANQLKTSQLLTQITQAIRQSLDTQEIFQTATKEIRQFLKADRVGIFQFEADANYHWGEFVAENVSADFSSAIAIPVRDRCFGDDCAVDYREGKVLAITDIYTEGLSNCHIEILERFQIRANLVIPLLQGQKLWGLLCIHQCSQPRQWQKSEIKFLQEISIQLGIALNHAELLTEAKQKSAQLQQALIKVQKQNEYQAEIAIQEQTLNQIIRNIRQSLDLKSIFTATTQEVRQILKCDRVVVYEFLPDWNGRFIFESVIPGLFKLATTNKKTDWYDSYLQEQRGGKYRDHQISAVDDIYTTYHSECHLEILEQFQIRAYLIVPVFIGETLWGLLAAYHHSSARNWKAREVNLLERISSQMGVALQQAELLRQMKQAKENADAANKSKSAFLANMSHELRTPLNAILGFSQLLQRDNSLNHKQQETLSIINRSGEHLLELINDVLEMSKIEAGKITIHCFDFDLDKLLESLQQMFSLKAESKGLNLIIKRTANVPRYIHADENKLRQVLINLLSNAIKFTKIGTVSLEVSLASESIIAEQKKQVIKFIIQDTGVGIAPEEMNSLFQPFSQTKSGIQSQEGTGLGLPLSHKLVQLMGGDLQLTSQQGKGTTIQFQLLVKEAQEIQFVETPTQKIVGLAPNQPQYRILVVEDKWESRKLLVQLLESIGFLVQEAENGLEAINIWEKWQPNLIWMDMQMPVMNGYESTQNIRAKQQQLQNNQTIIIALTASAFKEERDKILDAGCDDFLSKPFKESVLLEKIKQYLGLEFIYEEKVDNSVTKNNEQRLNNHDAQKILSLLSPEWVKQLNSAAIELDEDLILELINEIKVDYLELANTLNNWLDNCQFDLIIDCTKNNI